MNSNKVTQNTLSQGIYPIQVAARRSGLSQDTIRIWERRYRVISPQRDKRKRRLYNNDDIALLSLLRELTHLGYRIGDIAPLPPAELIRLKQDSPSAANHSKSSFPNTSPADHVANCLKSILNFDNTMLRRNLEHAIASFSLTTVLEEIITPLVQAIGEQWAQGELRIFHEHMATQHIITLLSAIRTTCNSRQEGPVIVVATPSGQHHELGALLAAVCAATDGWQDIYLGPDIPALELSAAANKVAARAVALSLTYPADDPRIKQELWLLRNNLPPETQLILGGNAAPAYASTTALPHSLCVPNLAEFRHCLSVLRAPAGR